MRPELVDTETETDGGDIFGYNRIFQEELKTVGFLKPEEFAAANAPSP